MTKKPTFKLSREAMEDLREIVKREIKEQMTDEQIEEMGVRLLRLFKVLLPEPPAVAIEPIKVTDDEFKALKYVHHCLYHESRPPSARGMSKALGHRSSRSGHRMLNALVKRGLLFRVEAGKVRMREDVAGCNPRMHVH